MCNLTAFSKVSLLAPAWHLDRLLIHREEFDGANDTRNALTFQGLSYAEPMLTIKRAAELTGVPAATLRIWERRYGVGAPSRSEAGYRLYDTTAILAIKEMRRLVESGWAPRQAAAEILALSQSEIATKSATAAEMQGDTLAELTQLFFAAVEALDSEKLSQTLDRAFSSGSFEYIVDQWLSPVLRELGSRWEAGVGDIAGEHFASNAIMRRLGAAFESAGQSVSGRRILIGAPSGSRHEIGILAMATAARRRGLQVIYLGANVPAQTWVEAAERYCADGVVIAVAVASDIPTAQKCIDALKKSKPSIIITTGGAGAGDVNGCDLALTGSISESSVLLEQLLH